MNIESIKDLIIFQCESGSHAYNLNTEKSDLDIRGIFRRQIKDYLKVSTIIDQINDVKQDIIFYDIKRILDLLRGANPNCIELLWIDKKNIIKTSKAHELLIANRDLFLTNRVFDTYLGYAYTQISKAKGKNKKVWNPWPEEKPTVLDYCRFIEFDDYMNFHVSLKRRGKVPANMPGRPVPIKNTKINLATCRVSKIEHVPFAYRLYDAPSDTSGVFRGTEESGYTLVTESIKIEEEWNNFIGILIFNEDEYKHACVQHRQYWEWVNNRNDNRWIDQESNNIDFDAKNMSHCFRLMDACLNIALNGFPKVRYEDNDPMRAFLMDVKAGKLKYEYLIELATENFAKIKDLENKSTLTDSIDTDKIDSLFREILEIK